MLVAFIAATSCSFSELDDIVTDTPGESSQIQVVGRVAQYSDCDVATRSKKEGDESKVTSMGLALFPIDDNGTIGNCLYYDFELGGSIVFIVDRHDDVFNNYVDKQFAMYIFANMQDAEGFPQTSEDGKGKSLEAFTKYAANANSNVKEVPANGFPMMGSLGGDGVKTLVLKPTAGGDNVDGLPLVDNVPTDNLEIPLKSMYAKFSFTIAVKPEQEIVGNKAPRFDLVEYSVNNIAATVDSDSTTNDDSDVIASSGEISMGSYAQGATTAKFYFYLPERYLSPSKPIDEVLPDELKKDTYGETVDADGNGYRDADEKYHQRFKNLLIDGKAATYVTIKGKFTDHHENTYDVDYNIYLGGNNYDDFNIIRNTHYENSVTIRGISASDDQAVNPGAISIDWRVNVARSTPLVIGLRRESLLDAHFEVRPLRLRLVGENIPTGTSATVQILKEDGTATDIPGWVRMEESGSTTDHITADGASKGKRKYFTTNLVTETLADGGKTIEVNNLDGSNKTVWIYVDENPTEVSRAALLRVTYAGDEQDFKIVQHGLYKVTGADSGHDYYIEQYEEYLYNYDSEDSYGQTKQEGMPWGLNGEPLSKEHLSFDNNRVPNVNWELYEKKGTRPYYDFYTWSQDREVLEAAGIAETDACHEYAGQHFTSDIYKKGSIDIKKLTMADQGSFAVEYCLNRNKRQSDGTINEKDIVWYLPSIDELEDFIVPAYNSFQEFQDKYYWSSQPAYVKNVFYYEYQSGSYRDKTTYAIVVYDDNLNYARATKVSRKGGTYVPAPSGLTSNPDSGINNTPSGSENLGYFDKMHYYKHYYSGFLQLTKNEVAGVDKLKDENQTKSYEEFNNTNDNKRYYVHLNHLYDLIDKTEDGEHGYHERTNNNRVRCVRVAPE